MFCVYYPENIGMPIKILIKIIIEEPDSSKTLALHRPQTSHSSGELIWKMLKCKQNCTLKFDHVQMFKTNVLIWQDIIQQKCGGLTQKCSRSCLTHRSDRRAWLHTTPPALLPLNLTDLTLFKSHQVPNQTNLNSSLIWRLDWISDLLVITGLTLLYTTIHIFMCVFSI